MGTPLGGRHFQTPSVGSTCNRRPAAGAPAANVKSAAGGREPPSKGFRIAKKNPVQFPARPIAGIDLDFRPASY